jgi:hypothetical protein
VEARPLPAALRILILIGLVVRSHKSSAGSATLAFAVAATTTIGATTAATHRSC